MRKLRQEMCLELPGSQAKPGVLYRGLAVWSGAASPISNSASFSCPPGDFPKLSISEANLESIWCTLLINLFQIIAANYWLV